MSKIQCEDSAEADHHLCCPEEASFNFDSFDQTECIPCYDPSNITDEKDTSRNPSSLYLRKEYKSDRVQFLSDHLEMIPGYISLINFNKSPNNVRSCCLCVNHEEKVRAEIYCHSCMAFFCKVTITNTFIATL